MRKYQSYIYIFILFMANAIAMILELAASRILGSRFGTTNIVWTAIIGIILLSNGVGNYLGGKLTDKYNNQTVARVALIISAISTAIIPVIYMPILDVISLNIEQVEIGSIIATMVLFAIPSTCIGILTPLITKIYLIGLQTEKRILHANQNASGSKAGVVACTNTLGGLMGTFVGGFYLVPTFGSSKIITICAVITMLLAVLLIDKKHLGRTVMACIIIGAVCAATMQTDTSQIKGTMIYETDSDMNHIMVYENEIDNKPARLLWMEGWDRTSSISFTEPEDRYELSSATYLQKFKNGIPENKQTACLMIGGGGYTFPKYLIAHYPQASCDVVEIDGKVTETAKKYFYLRDLIDEYQTDENGRLNLITADARVYLNKLDKKYDAIINDAFAGGHPVGTLATDECVANVKRALNENGIYMMNIIATRDDTNQKFLTSELKTIRKHFDHVVVIPCTPNVPESNYQNFVLYASDSQFTFDGEITIDDSNGIILTDDYAPVESMYPAHF